MSEASSEAQVGKFKPGRTQWHRLLAKLLELLLTPVGITVQSEVPITSEPPKVDIVLLRRNGDHWTVEQMQLLCDGLRDSGASDLLVEFKYSEPFNASALLQGLSYEYFYRQSQQLSENQIATFVMVATTPRKQVLEQFGFVESRTPGVYQSKLPLLSRIQLIVLNQLHNEPHNAFVQTFASQRKVRQQAFAQLDNMSSEVMAVSLLELVAGLRSQYEVREGIMKAAELTGEITPELLMKLGREVRRSVVQNLTPEELAAIPPEKRLAGLAPEERLAGLAPEELTKLLAQVEAFLRQQGSTSK